MAFVDPFTQVYDRMWELLEANPRFTSLVPSNNRIKWTQDKNVTPQENALTSDRARVEIVPSPGGGITLFVTSHTSVIVQTYAIRVETGDNRVHRVLFPIKFEIARAFAGAGDSEFGLKLQAGKVEKVRIVDSFEESFTTQSNRSNDKGWELALLIQVTFRFDSKELASGAFV